MRLALLLLLSGCASTNPLFHAQEIYAPDGKPALYVECGLSEYPCHSMARERCNGAYTSSGAVVAPTGRHSLTFRCQ